MESTIDWVYSMHKQTIDMLRVENAELKSICESLKIANAEKDRVLSKLIDEALLREGG